MPQRTRRVRPPTLRARVAARTPERLSGFVAFLQEETNGGKLLLAGTAVALVWANLAPGTYGDVWGTRVSLGPAQLHLDGLPLRVVAADGLLAVFFFVAGLELKRELTVGELSTWRAAALPVFAAVGGMVVPAVVFLAVARGATGAGSGWAVPVATDIAFALGVLALAGKGLPASLRVIMLSMAVVDDLGAIALIAVQFTAEVLPLWLLAGALVIAAYAGALRRGVRTPWVLVPLGLAAWVCIHASGVHATVAGVLLGLVTPVTCRPGETETPCERLERRLHPVSAGFVVPVFALATTGLPLAALPAAVRDPVAQGIVAGLVIGKATGILGGAWLAVRLRVASLPTGVSWADLVPLAVLGGIGYTVSLLITELAFSDRALGERAALAVLAASTLATTLALLLLRRRVAALEPAS